MMNRKITPIRHVVFVVIFMAGCWQAHAQSNQREQLYQDLQEAYNNEDYEACLDFIPQLSPLIQNKKDTLTSNTWATWGDAHYFTGIVDSAKFYYEKAYDLSQDLPVYDSSDYSGLVYNLGYVYMELGDYHEALPLFNELQKLDAQAFGKQSESYVETVLNLAFLQEKTGQLDKAEGTYKDLGKVLGQEHQYYAIVISNQAGLLSQMGRYTAAESNLLKALDLIAAAAGTENENYLGTLINLGELYRVRGEFAKAEEIILQCQNIIKAWPEEQKQTYKATLMNNLALVYKYTGRYELAEDLLNSLVAIDRATLGEGHPTFANTLHELADLYSRTGVYQKSDSLYQEAEAILADALGKDHVKYGYSLLNHAIVLRRMGEYEQALQLFDQSAKVIEGQLSKDHQDYVTILHHTGITYLNTNQVKPARNYLKDAVKGRVKILGKKNPRYAETTQELAFLNWYKDNTKATQKHFTNTFDNYFFQIDALFPVMSEEEKAAFYKNKIRQSFEAFNSFVMDNVEESPELLGNMYDYQLATKALIMYATNKVRDRILNSGDSTLINQYYDWINLKERISKRYSVTADPSSTEQEKIDSLEDKAFRLEKSLSQASSTFMDTYIRKDITWQDVRNTLEPGEAAVEMIRYREFKPDSGGVATGEVRYVALIVHPDTKDHPEYVLLENGSLLENRFLNNYRNAIHYKMQESRSYKAYWKPVQDKLGDVKKIFFSPDGVYNQINLNTLFNDETGEYLLEEMDIQQVTNTKDLIAYHEGGEQNGLRSGKALLFGYPNYNKGLATTEEQASKELAHNIATSVQIDRSLRGSLQRYIRGNELLALLPGTKEEVGQITEILKSQGIDYETYMENEAEEEQVKSLQFPASLHIATHGFFLEDQHHHDADFLANPLLRSGLIMAGANTFLRSGDQSMAGNEDGILTAYEAMNLNLDDAELVILSACETGLGEVKNGEGVYGLQRAFQVAGAETLVMSMWTVDDRATQELMTTFYEKWIASGNKHEAFRQAQLEIKEQFESPVYWGAFVMVGK